MVKQKQDGTTFLFRAMQLVGNSWERNQHPCKVQQGNPGTANPKATSSANVDGKSRDLSRAWTLQTTAPRGLILHKAEEEIVYHGYFSQRIVLPK